MEPVLKPQSDLCRALGRRFRSVREERGIGLRVLAEQMGVALYLIRRHEAGALMLRLDKIHAAATAMAVPVRTLTEPE
jgi:transcriptional regulator with XRE-family HTH domain